MMADPNTPRMDVCPNCKGSGIESIACDQGSHGHESQCYACNGTGKITLYESHTERLQDRISQLERELANLRGQLAYEKEVVQSRQRELAEERKARDEAERLRDEMSVAHAWEHKVRLLNHQRAESLERRVKEIEAETIERCAKVCFDVIVNWKTELPFDYDLASDIRNQFAEAIRALKESAGGQEVRLGHSRSAQSGEGDSTLQTDGSLACSSADHAAGVIEGMRRAAELFSGLSYGPYEHPAATIRADADRLSAKTATKPAALT